jgi:DNA-binding CsgD family transcriptional regulator
MNKRNSKNHLTRAEGRVLSLIGQGKISKEIAASLAISLLTVGNHRKSLCRKLNVHSTAELAAYAAFAHGASPPVGTRCSLDLKLTTEHGDFAVSYRSPLTEQECLVTVCVGSVVFRF